MALTTYSCNNSNVKRHFLNQVRARKPKGIYIAEFLSGKKQKIYNSILKLRKEHPTVIKKLFTREGAVFAKIGDSIRKFDTLEDVVCLNLQAQESPNCPGSSTDPRLPADDCLSQQSGSSLPPPPTPPPPPPPPPELVEHGSSDN